MKRTWLLRLTPEQFEKLKAGLHTRFRFYLNLSYETVTYENPSLTVRVPDGKISDEVSDYINGFACAIY